jgi:hypothetical protein
MTPQNLELDQKLTAVTCTNGCFAVGVSGGSGPPLIEQYVGRDPTGVTIICSPNPVRLGARTKCTARATDAFTSDALAGALTWNADFGHFNTSTCTLRSGSCVVRFRANHFPSSTITATYAADATHASYEESLTVPVVLRHH